MKNPMKNTDLENLARSLALAIRNEDGKQYAKLMKEAKPIMDGLKRWELMALRDRIHHISVGDQHP